MATYNIYGYDNGENDPPVVQVVLSDDDSKIVQVIPRDSDEENEIEDVLRDYIKRGATPLQALAQYAGSYGSLEKNEPDNEIRPENEGNNE